MLSHHGFSFRSFIPSRPPVKHAFFLDLVWPPGPAAVSKKAWTRYFSLTLAGPTACIMELPIDPLLRSPPTPPTRDALDDAIVGL